MGKIARKKMRFPISQWVAISQPRVKTNKCIHCNQAINKLGIIIYMNHDTHRAYRWIHIDCLKKTNPLSCIKNFFIQEESFKQEVTSSAVGCSFCGQKNKTKPLQNFLFFYLHKNCIPELYEKAKKLYKKNRANIIANML